MRILTPYSLVLVAASSGLLLAPLLPGAARPTLRQDGASPAERVTEPAELFRTSCAVCHLAPDPEHATDRAWLTQVKDTA